MNYLTHTQVSEYPWEFQPEWGYEYAEFHSACEVCRDNGIQEGHALCYLAETIPNTYEAVSSPVLLSAGWYVLARRYALGTWNRKGTMNKQKVLAALEKLRDTALEGHREYETLYISEVASNPKMSAAAAEESQKAQREIHELFETIWEEVI